MDGVVDAEMGFTGGREAVPSYFQKLDHVESVRVVYDPGEISYQKLLDTYWSYYVGPSGNCYQSDAAIWHHTDEQRELIEKSLETARASGVYDDYEVSNISVEPAGPWYVAEGTYGA